MDNMREELVEDGEKDTGMQTSKKIENKSTKPDDENFSDPKSLNESELKSFGDFEMVSTENIPNAESEEIRRMNNTPNMLGLLVNCAQQTGSTVLDYLPEGHALPNLGGYIVSFVPWLAADNNTEDPPEVVNIKIEDQLTEEIQHILEEVTTFEDETCSRECLENALVDNCKEVIEENVTGNAAAMDLLQQKGCINKEEQLYLKGKSDDLSQSTRSLFSLIIGRDLKTLYTFVCILKSCNSQSLFEKISSDFHKHKNKKGKMSIKCSRCVLVNRVNIRTVVDFFAKWTGFFQKVSESKLHESKGLWEEFIQSIKSRSMYEEVVFCLLKAIEACGFHSDILLMLCADVGSNNDLFECRCQDVCNNSDAYWSRFGNRKDILQKANLIIYGQNNGIETTCTVTYVERKSVGSRESVCLEPATEKACYQTSSENIENKEVDVQNQPSSLKRKNSFVEDSQHVERPKKRASDNSAVRRQDCWDTSNGDTKPQPNDDKPVCKVVTPREKEDESIKGDSLSEELKLDSLKVDVQGYDCEQDSVITESQSLPVSMPSANQNDMGDKNIKGKLDEKHRLNNFKIGVVGYDSEQDSGFSQTQSLTKEVDSGNYDDQNVKDSNETAPKQIASGPITPTLTNRSCKLQDTQEAEESKLANSLESIDADCEERDESCVNNEALEDALEETFDSAVKQSDQGNDVPKSDSEIEPFINIVLK